MYLEYVRGQGWVYPTAPEIFVTLGNGNTYRLESRYPKPGEYYTHVRKTSRDWHTDGVPNPTWVNWISGFPTIDYANFAGLGYEPDPLRVYVVLVSV